MSKFNDALSYHANGRPGKIEIKATKPFNNQRDLSLAYSPGVAEPCLKIAENPMDVYKYTAKSNLVAVLSNGSAVLGLGNIGAAAGKPVMEGKGVLFKKYADIDVFDIEVNTQDPDEIIKTCQLLEPTFGGINLEDIKAPECFYIEEKLKETMNIPVFHDDQHGTAIIAGAAFINALEIQGKKIENVKIVFSGAGAAGVACANLFFQMGAKRENCRFVDSKGVIYKGRTAGMNPVKEPFAVETEERSLEDAMNGADAFVGVSVGGIVSQDMVKSMADKPIVFALANPDPEISYPDALAVREDVIMATGRSDFPNQVNNVLGFPYIFRGALDVHAKHINDDMKIAAVKALADLAKEDVPDSILLAYGLTELQYGPEYIIPKPGDPRILIRETVAVAKAAMSSGVARHHIDDFEEYEHGLVRRFGQALSIQRELINRAKMDRRIIVFPEGEQRKVIRAAEILEQDKIAHPVLLGQKKVIEERMKEMDVKSDSLKVIDPMQSNELEHYAEVLYKQRQRKGMTKSNASLQLKSNKNAFGSMMVNVGDADGLISGNYFSFQEVVKPAIQSLKEKSNIKLIAGMHVVAHSNQVYYFADTTINIDPSYEELAEIAIMARATAMTLGCEEPRIAMISFGNYGSVRSKEAEKVAKAVQLVKDTRQDVVIDGEMQFDTAMDPEKLNKYYAFNSLEGGSPNIFVFPNLASGNASFKVAKTMAQAEVIGPILMGLNYPIHVLETGSSVEDIVRMSALAAVQSQKYHKKRD